MEKKKMNLYIIAGCNGAGKTTASFTVLPEMLGCREFVNADEIAAGLSPFNPEGVAIQADDYSSSTQFLYTHLAELKPEMVEQATANARATAAKFAEDADCKLGSLVTASQGSFSISEDATTPHIKNIRVVTNVTYNLK